MRVSTQAGTLVWGFKAGIGVVLVYADY